MRKRSEGFWGIHSDFHATPDFGVQGRNLREEDIREICQLLKPDYWQIDSKGHPGWASFPTELGNAMPEFACDTFAVWRKATAEEDVALVAHYSGVFDQKYCAAHPDHALTQLDGHKSPNFTRLTGNYVDEVVIPQLSELAGKYGFNGAWVDGECWAVDFDYSPETIAAFEKETGIKLEGKCPRWPEDPYVNEYREFLRVLYRRYLKHYVDTIHERYPGFELTANWVYSDHAMEKPTVDVDFLSGDYSPWNCVHWARYSGRALALQGKPWDLMVWGMRSGSQTEKPDLLYVHPAQLLQDAAVTISLGGGFQVDVHQYPDGSPRMPELRQLVPVAEFMRAREPYCFKGKFLPQTAILLSSYDSQLSGLPFCRDNAEQKVGLTALLCDAGQSVEMVSEHTLEGRYADYPMIILPELVNGLAKETIEQLLGYARNGGNLVLTGANTCRIFAEAGAPFTVNAPKPDEERPVVACVRTHDAEIQRYFTMDGISFGAVMHPVEINTENADVIASLCYNERSIRYPFAVIMDYGQGKIAAVGNNIGLDYYNGSQYMHRRLIKAISDKLYVPKARIESVCGMLEIVCLQKNGKLMLQLVNVNGNHSNDRCATEDMIPPVLDIRMSVACSSDARLMLQPEGRELSYEYIDGRAYFKIDRLDIHNVVEVIE